MRCAITGSGSHPESHPLRSTGTAGGTFQVAPQIPRSRYWHSWRYRILPHAGTIGARTQNVPEAQHPKDIEATAPDIGEGSFRDTAKLPSYHHTYDSPSLETRWVCRCIHHRGQERLSIIRRRVPPANITGLIGNMTRMPWLIICICPIRKHGW